MDILKEIFKHEVFPAIGCTEPISCAYAAAAAAELVAGKIEKLTLIVDAGTFKNGAAVTVPHSGKRKGNSIAAALGAFIAKPTLQLEILKEVTPEILEKAVKFVENNQLEYKCKEEHKGFYIEVIAERESSKGHCVISEGNTNIILLEKDGVSKLKDNKTEEKPENSDTYRQVLKDMKLEKLIEQVTKLDDKTRTYIQKGIELNMAISELGAEIKRTAYQMKKMHDKGIIADDLFFQVEYRVAAAVDARMSGLPMPVMTSGGSGNQGIVAILVPHITGTYNKVSRDKIHESIAISHAVNSYIKCYIGELSVICGCALAAGISSSMALVYQKVGIDMKKMNLAMNNVIGDLGGLICDGAKPGCAMKTVSAANTALRSAFMAMDDYGLSMDDGMLGISAEDSIKNLGRITLEGMLGVDPTVVHILQDKAGRQGRA